MGRRGPVPKLRRLGHTSAADRESWDRVARQVCARDGCEAIVGQVRHDPAGRWCARGHGQHEDVPDGRQFWHPPPPL